MTQFRFGIDLGGTKIELVALPINAEQQGSSQRLLYQKRMDTPKGDYRATVQAVTDLVLEAEAKLGGVGLVGIGIPGSVSSKTGRIKNANSTCLIGRNLQGDLQQLLNRPIFLANDANCFALSEAVEGVAKGANVVFGVILGTGCGGGVAVKKSILNGVNAIGGEWGHNPLPWTTDNDILLPCYCGLTGCNETFLSGSGLEAHYTQRTGREKTAKAIFASTSEDEVAAQLVQNYIIWLAKGLASVINLIDPDVIVLGGGLSNVEQLYTEVPKIWHEWVFSDEVKTRLLPPKFGDSSGVRGAAWLSKI